MGARWREGGCGFWRVRMGVRELTWPAALLFFCCFLSLSLLQLTAFARPPVLRSLLGWAAGTSLTLLGSLGS